MHRRSRAKFYFNFFVITAIFVCSVCYFFVYQQYIYKIERIKVGVDFTTDNQKRGGGKVVEEEICSEGLCNVTHRLWNCMNEEKWKILSTVKFAELYLIPLDDEFAYCMVQKRRKARILALTTFGLLPKMNSSNAATLHVRLSKSSCVPVVKKRSCKILKCSNGYYFRLITITDKQDYWLAPSCSLDSVPGSQAQPFAVKKLHLKSVNISGLPMQYPLDFVMFRKHLSYSKFVECNRTLITTLKKKFPTYYKAKPKLTDENFEWFVNLRDLLNGYGMTPMLVGGTLLGWARECGIIPYTHDFDVMVLWDEYNEHFEQILLNHHELKLRYRFNKIDDALEYAVIDPTNAKTDIFFLYQEANHSWIGGIGRRRTKVKFTYPSLKHICSTDLLGFLFHVPCNYMDYVIGDYGKMWYIPVHDDDFIYYNDSQAISILKKLTRDEYFSEYFHEFD